MLPVLLVSRAWLSVFCMLLLLLLLLLLVLVSRMLSSLLLLLVVVLFCKIVLLLVLVSRTWLSAFRGLFVVIVLVAVVVGPGFQDVVSFTIVVGSGPVLQESLFAGPGGPGFQDMVIGVHFIVVVWGLLSRML